MAERTRMTRKPSQEPEAAPIQVLPDQSPEGAPLAAETRADVEPLFGFDFGQVRIFADDRATESARDLDAQAYTSGSSIVFDRGRYAPETPAGRDLLVHELGHVVQQARGEIGGFGGAVVPPDHATERTPVASATPQAVRPLPAIAAASAIQREPNNATPPAAPAPAAAPGATSTDKSAATSVDTVASDLVFYFSNASAHREDILRHMLRMAKQEDALAAAFKKASNGKEFDAELRSALVTLGTFGLNDYIRSKRYLKYGELRTADKLYFAAEGAGTDMPTIERLLPAIHAAYTQVEADFTAEPDYLARFPKQAKLPNGQMSHIGGVIEDEFIDGADSPDVIKAKAKIAFGEPQPLDLVRAAASTDELLSSLNTARKAVPDGKTLADQFQARYPEKLLQLHLEQKLSGDDITRSKMIMEGNYSARARLKLAVDGKVFIDEKQVWAALQEASPEEIASMRADYQNKDSDFYKMLNGGLLTGLSKDAMVRVEAMLGAAAGEDATLTKLKANGGVAGAEIVKVIKMAAGADLKSYRDAYNDGNSPLRKWVDEKTDAAEKGLIASYLQDSLISRVKFALEQLDTDYLFHLLSTMAGDADKRAIAADPALMGKFDSTLNTRDANKVKDLLIPSDATPEEKANRLSSQVQRESSFLMGASANQAALEDEQRALAITLEQAKLDGKIDAAEAAKLGTLTKSTEEALKAYTGVRDELAGYVETVLSVAAGLALTAVTAGAGAGVSGAMLASAVAKSALATAVMNVVVKKIARGDQFDAIGADGAAAFVGGFVDGTMNVFGGPVAKTALGGSLGATARLAAYESGQAAFTSSGKVILTRVVEGFVGGAPGAMVGSAAEDATWKNGMANGFQIVLTQGATAGAQGSATAVIGGAVTDAKDAKSGGQDVPPTIDPKNPGDPNAGKAADDKALHDPNEPKPTVDPNAAKDDANRVAKSGAGSDDKGPTAAQKKAEDDLEAHGPATVRTPVPESFYSLHPTYAEASKEYWAQRANDPEREVAIWFDPVSKDFAVVQGDRISVPQPGKEHNPTAGSKPEKWSSRMDEFSARGWTLKQHYHPGEDFMVRFPSEDDFKVIWGDSQLAPGDSPPQPVESVIDWIDPTTKKPQQTTISYNPGPPEKFAVKYLDHEGAWQIEHFYDKPWNDGSAYKKFMKKQELLQGLLARP